MVKMGDAAVRAAGTRCHHDRRLLPENVVHSVGELFLLPYKEKTAVGW